MKLKPYIFGLIIAVLAEILIFNISSIVSLSNNSVDFSSCLQIGDTEEGCEVLIENIDLKIKNLLIKTDCQKDVPVNYHLALTDEGNYYEYYLPEGMITSSSKASSYVNLHPYGKVHSLRISLDCPKEQVKNISANVKRPLCFNIWRVLMVFYVFVLFFGIPDTQKLRIPATVACIVLILGAGLFLVSSHKLFNESLRPHHQQYKELAHELAKGQVYLPDEPSKELMEASNPYDTIYLQAKGIEYKADYAYYKGKYYVYFGIVPEALLYLPCYVLTGKDLPNYAASFIFYSLYVLGTFGFFGLLWEKYFKKANFGTYLLTSSFASLMGNVIYIVFTADIYSVPIMAGLAFTMLGLFFWMLGLRNRNGKNSSRIVCYAIGSLCMALVSGCRPQMLLYSLFGIPLFWKEIFTDRKLFSKAGLGQTIALFSPYIFIAILVMYYNYARFGSVFDFGATYSLTNNDMNLRGISGSRMLMGLGTFLFAVPGFRGVYPFLQSSSMDFSYMGRVVTEYLFGGMIASNVLMWCLVLIPANRKAIKEKGLVLFTAVNLLSSIIIGLADANAAGMLQRYTADMAIGLILATTVIIFILGEQDRRYAVYLKVGLLLELAYSFLIVLNVDSGITLRMFNPELFNRIGDLFRF